MDLKHRARQLRSHATDAEVRLWQSIRKRQLLGYKFRRQFVIAPYIVDLISLELKLVIELDGGQHMDQHACDKKRTDFISSKGFRVIRFWNDDVLRDIDVVLEEVRRVIVEQERCI